MVKILFDSASDISFAEAEAMGAELISIKIRFGDEEFSDGVNITREEFFEKLSGTFKNAVSTLCALLKRDCARRKLQPHLTKKREESAFLPFSIRLNF